MRQQRRRSAFQRLRSQYKTAAAEIKTGLNDALVLCVSLPQGGPVVAPDCVGLGD